MIHLVACTKQKAPVPCAARELYWSPWFAKARAYVERRGGPWYILSAEHGLVRPDQLLAPYERTLHAMTRAERAAWGARVRGQLAAVLPPSGPVVVLAGELYRAPLVELLGDRLEVPMRGLGIGRQLAWLSRAR